MTFLTKIMKMVLKKKSLWGLFDQMIRQMLSEMRFVGC